LGGEDECGKSSPATVEALDDFVLKEAGFDTTANADDPPRRK
jgi:hypothetical protein